MGSHFWLNLIATTYILFKTFHFHCGLQMIRLSVLLGLFLLVSGVLLPGIPQNFDDRDTDEEVAELLTDLFREAKDIDIENEVENNDVEDDLEEQKLNTDPVEVAKYNTYMDAVYRRMNAALRAKLMDPMELNLDSKQNKNPRNSKKDKSGGKSRNSRAVEDDEEPQDDEKELVEDDNEEGIDRLGKAAKKEKNKDSKAKKKGRNRKLPNRQLNWKDRRQKKLKEPIKVPRRTNLRKLLKDKRQRKEIQERLMMEE